MSTTMVMPTTTTLRLRLPSRSDYIHTPRPSRKRKQWQKVNKEHLTFLYW
nr:MAG TPA: hypothetical protein [Caudoviricetes sp.]